MKKTENNLRALIVEDDEDTAKLISQVIHKTGIPSLIASNGIIGLQLFHKEKPDIVFSNFIMPEMGGVELFWEIRKVDSEIPIVLFSGRYWELNKKFAREPIKPNFMLKKPFGISQIYKILQECFPNNHLYKGMINSDS